MDLQNPNLNSSTPPKKPVNWTAYVIAGLVVLILVLGGVIINLNRNPKGLNTDQSPDQGAVTPPPPPQDDQVKDDEQKIPGKEYISVQWLPEWKETSMKPPHEYVVKVFEAGKVTQGKYTGGIVYVLQEESLGYYYSLYLIHEDKEFNLDGDSNILIRGIDDLPEATNFSGTQYTLKVRESQFFPFKELPLGKKVYTDPVFGDVYLSDGCLVAELPNHMTVVLDLNIPFLNTESRTIDVTFKDGSKPTDPYTYNDIIGCVALCFYLDEVSIPQTELMEIGKTSNNEPIYGFIDSNHKALKDLYEDKNTVAYYNTEGGYEQLPKSKYTYEEFLSFHPLLYWKDPLGRYIQFTNDRFMVAAEMCKPVIYLYPSSPTDLTVKVFPNGGFTYTLPLYNNGWKVTAYPDGTVKDLSDGKIYPYLFWEGIGLNYPAQDTGFVVKREDLEKFLTEKTLASGLVGREAQDFLDYWVPRLKGLNKPYVKISFLKKEQMDEIAPLEMSKNPTSVIRVMITAKGLDKWENVPAQEMLTQDERSTFTLVEWGGAVLR